MGEPITRLNPQVESQVQRILFVQAIELILKIVMILPENNSIKPGPKPYDYRMILSLCIFRILLRKTYADYEIEMRTDSRICKPLGLQILPGKSTVQRSLAQTKMDMLRKINSILLEDWTKRRLNILLDASGIRIVGRSVWFSLRAKRPISRRECDKIHIAVCSDVHVILNWFITEGKRHDSPFFKRLLAPFKFLGFVLADVGYLARKNVQYVSDRNGAVFIPFKKGNTAKPKSHPAWKYLFKLWKLLPMLCKSIYNQRPKVEAVFAALKKRYGDRLDSKGARMRRREMAMRFLAYNIRIVICYRYANEQGLLLWVRAKQ